MKHIEYSSEARAKLLSGVNIISRAVSTTLGPSGRNVLIRNKKERVPFSTKDGVTVAGNIWSSDPIEMMAIESILDVANLADEHAGDGTTTATVLAQYIFAQSLNNSDSANLIDIKRGIDIAVAEIVEKLREHSISCSENFEILENVALVASNYDSQIASMVKDAFIYSGKQGVVRLQRSRTYENYITNIKGMNLPMGFISPFFITDHKEEVCMYDNAYVYMTNKKIDKVSPNFEYLCTELSERQAPLLIICEDIIPSVLNMLVHNFRNGSLKVCVCKAPGFGQERVEMLKDLGTVLGKAPFIENEGIDFEEISKDNLLDFLPICSEIMVTEQQTSFREASTDTDQEQEQIMINMQARADMLRKKLEGHVDSYEKSVLQTRISRLSDGLAYINISAHSDTEYIEKQHRVQDALHAVKNASQEGVLPGGGTALYSISHDYYDKDNFNKDVNYGRSIVYSAIRKPFLLILSNAGISIDKNKLSYISENFHSGIDARNGEFKEDMIASGIVDPLKTIRVALENASSIAGLMMTTECVIVDSSVYQEEQKSLF